MFTKSKLLLSAAVILGAASGAPAKDVGVPTIDIQKICRASEREIRALFSDVTRDVFGPCMDDEREARAELVKNWATVPAFDKERCVQPAQYLPSYVEWLICVQMTEDVRKMLKNQPPPSSAGVQSSPSRADSANRQCPGVQWQKDGLIGSMVAC
jgi:hypothetical protein